MTNFAGHGNWMVGTIHNVSQEDYNPLEDYGLANVEVDYDGNLKKEINSLDREFIKAINSLNSEDLLNWWG